MSLDMDMEAPKPRTAWRRVAILAVAGLAFGLPAGFGFGRWVKSTTRAHLLTVSDIASLVIAVVLVAMGLMVVVFTVTRRGAAYLADPHATEPYRDPYPGQRFYFQAQGLVLVLAGLMMATPVMLVVARPDLDAALGLIVMLGLIAAFILQTALNITVWSRSDELIRRSISDAGAVSFWVLQGALFLWAAGEKLTLLPHLTSWDALTVLMGFYLVMSVVVSYRRGLS
jgi:hypothetical protein